MKNQILLLLMMVGGLNGGVGLARAEGPTPTGGVEQNFIALENWPCANGTCREICTYRGSSNYNGKLTLETQFERKDGQISVRTLGQIDARVAFFKIGYLADERVLMNDKSLRLEGIETNLRSLRDSAIKRQRWDRYEFDWGTEGLKKTRQVLAHNIEGESQSDVAQTFPNFLRQWPIPAFGSQWWKDFVISKPRERDFSFARGFRDDVTSPGILAAFLMRFMDESAPRTMDPFFDGKEKDPKAGPITAKPVVTDDTITWQAKVAVFGASTPDDEPAQIVIDRKTRQVKSMKFTVAHDLATVRGQVQLVGCRTEAL